MIVEIISTKAEFPTSYNIQFLSSFVNLNGIFLLLFFIIPYSLSFYNLLFIIPALEVYVFSLGVALFISQATVFFRDVVHIYAVVITRLK